MKSRLILSTALIFPMLISAALPIAPAAAATAFSPGVQVAAADKPSKGKKKKGGAAGAADSLVTDIGSLLGGGKSKSGKGKKGKHEGGGIAGKHEGGGIDDKTGSGKSKGHGKPKKS